MAIKESLERQFPTKFNKYQASKMFGDYQVVARGSESAEETIKDLYDLVVSFEKHFPKVVADVGEVETKTDTQSWQHPCPKCRGETEFRKGVKGDKAWSGWFCKKSRDVCDGVEWV